MRTRVLAAAALWSFAMWAAAKARRYYNAIDTLPAYPHTADLPLPELGAARSETEAAANPRPG